MTTHRFEPSASIIAFLTFAEVETFHRTIKENFGLTEYHGRELCGHIAHIALVYMAYTLTIFVQRYFPSLKGENLDYIMVSIMRAVARVKVSSS